MKSNEEFIAGIYEKAATYTEEKDIRIVKTNWAAKAARIAAMAAVCIGLTGIGALVFGRNSGQGPIPSPVDENYGIALTSETGDDVGGATQLRVGPVVETVTFTGIVEKIDAEEKRIWLRLTFDENAPDYVEGSIVCIRWDMLEKIEEEITVGTKLTAMGVLSQYENEASEHNGCAELVLTDKENLEIRGTYGIQ